MNQLQKTKIFKIFNSKRNFDFQFFYFGFQKFIFVVNVQFQKTF